MSSFKPFPGFEHLYSMGDATGEESFHADFETPEGMDDRDLLRAELVPAEPLLAYWSLGAREPKEVARGTSTDRLYVHRNVLQLLENAGLTGWSTYPLMMHNKAGEVCEGYAGFCVTGRCGPIDEGRGKLLNPGSKFPRYCGMCFEESTWDGSDFFCCNGIEYTGYVFVTEAVKRVFMENRITGLRFTPLTEETWLGSPEDDEEEEEDEFRFVESLYMDQTLDPAGYVTPMGEPPPPEVLIDFTVMYPCDNAVGHKGRVFNTFDAAKAFVLHLQEQGIEEAMILRSHQLIWRSPSLHEDWKGKGIEDQRKSS